MNDFILKNISFSYPNSDKLVLDNISTNINNGEFVCVLGKSGCGKSTLLKLFAGLNIPSKGELLFEDSVIKSASLDRGVVFQDYGLFPWMTAGENIILALKQRYRNRNANELKEIAIDSLKQVGLDDKVYNTLPKYLSGGMQQRVAIAQVLSVNPKVFLMDEPFGALDAVTRAKLQDLILELWNKNKVKKTVIFITHDVDEAIYLANRIIVLGQSPSKIIYDKKISLNEKTSRENLYTDEKMMLFRNELIQIINKDISEKTLM
ncbi:MAG: ABC transporter ATP-binding protein [Lachnospiraceae bacterium]|nr:ABC transporter ATP-binding protein [Lachnospiraceae bacterium]